MRSTTPPDVLFLLMLLHPPGVFGDASTQSTASTAAAAAALLRFKATLHNPGIMEESSGPWVGEPCSSVNTSSWLGVVCSNGSVAGINMTKLNLQGPLAKEWSVLTELRTVDLSCNNLTGTLPASWGNITSMAALNLNDNNLTGTLPESWGNMKGLKTIDVMHNMLTGGLPSNWSGFKQLTYLNVMGNKLSGYLPQEWGGMTAMQEICLHNNRFEGRLPAGWSTMKNLRLFYAPANMLTGPLPSSWSSMTQLVKLYVYRNKLTGTLPAEWAAWNQMADLELYENKLQGTLPPDWNNMPCLLHLEAHNNTLSGPLPAQWSSMRLNILYLQNNQLTGPLPQKWGNLNLNILNLSSNSLTGSLPAAWVGTSIFSKDIRVLDLSENRLSGSIPTAVGGKFAQSLSYPNQATPMVLAPMTSKYGLCGSIPADAVVRTGGGHSLLGQMEQGICPASAAALPRWKAAVIGSAVSLSVIAVAVATVLLLRSGNMLRSGSLYAKLWRNTASGGSSKESLTQYKSMGMDDLKFEKKDGKRVMLGKGSFGVVYKGKWRGLVVAVKILTSKDLVQQDQFREETKLLESLRHPHVVNYLGHIFEENKEMMLVTEFMPGDDLGTCIRKDVSVPRVTGWYGRGQSILMGLARGLVYLHSQHIVWFDCKPGNVLLDQTGSVAKIADVGLSKMLAGSQTETMLRGTRGYMAPELFCGYIDEERNPVTKAVDIYSFGVLIWEVVTGQKLLLGQGLRKPRVPEECPQGVVNLYLSCLQSDPMLRPSAEALMESIERHMAVLVPAMKR